MIQCYDAAATGYECLPYYQLMLLLPLSGSCPECIEEQRQQSEGVEVEIGIEVLFDYDDEMNKEIFVSQNTNAETVKSPVPIPGYHTHLYPRFDGESKTYSNWDTKEDVNISDYDDLCPSPCFSCDESIYSKLDSEQNWSRQEYALPDSPTLNYDVSMQWGFPSNSYVDQTWQSKIPVPVSRAGTKVQEEQERVWDADELELFDQLTF